MPDNSSRGHFSAVSKKRREFGFSHLPHTHLVGQDAPGFVRELAARRPLGHELGAAPRLEEVLAVAGLEFAVGRVEVRSIIYRGVKGAVLLRLCGNQTFG